MKSTCYLPVSCEYSATLACPLQSANAFSLWVLSRRVWMQLQLEHQFWKKVTGARFWKRVPDNRILLNNLTWKSLKKSLILVPPKQLVATLKTVCVGVFVNILVMLHILYVLLSLAYRQKYLINPMYLCSVCALSIERWIRYCRIHTLGSANRSRNHPDCRAILFEDMTYRYHMMFHFHFLLLSKQR